MNKLKHLNVPIFLLFFFLLFSCSEEDDNINPSSTQFGIFAVQADETTVRMDGEITSSTLNDFNQLLQNYPNVNRIEIVECEGSSDDEINLQVSLKVHQQGIETHLNDNGLIASGGVDFFLAGIRRTKGSNTQIGVHSWGGEDDDGNEISATDFPVGHSNHLPYIEYYQAVGFSQQDAEDFYYFTINAAAPEDIHWMTDAEIAQYNILKN